MDIIHVYTTLNTFESMPKFAVYYIPKKGHPLYQLGSQVIGYDIRKEKEIAFHKELINYPKKQIEKAVGKAKKYGFHLTIGDSIDFKEEQLSLIKNKLSELIRTSNPNTDWMLNLKHLTDIQQNIRLGKRGACLLEYQENIGIKEFHRLVCTELNTLGTGSAYKDDIKNKKWNPAQINKIQKYFSPYILDAYTPHFTFMNPLIKKDMNNKWLTGFISMKLNILENIDYLEVENVCLMVQDNVNSYWRIEEEFDR